MKPSYIALCIMKQDLTVLTTIPAYQPPCCFLSMCWLTVTLSSKGTKRAKPRQRNESHVLKKAPLFLLPMRDSFMFCLFVSFSLFCLMFFSQFIASINSKLSAISILLRTFGLHQECPSHAQTHWAVKPKKKHVPLERLTGLSIIRMLQTAVYTNKIVCLSVILISVISEEQVLECL